MSRSARSTIAGNADRLVEVRASALEVIDGRGGGDSMTAALAVAAVRRLGFEDGLRIAAAAATLNVSRHGLGTGRRDTIEELAEHVEIRSINEGATPSAIPEPSISEESTKADLYRHAQRLDIAQRSKMTRLELLAALRQATNT